MRSIDVDPTARVVDRPSRCGRPPGLCTTERRSCSPAGPRRPSFDQLPTGARQLRQLGLTLGPPSRLLLPARAPGAPLSAMTGRCVETEAARPRAIAGVPKSCSCAGRSRFSSASVTTRPNDAWQMPQGGIDQGETPASSRPSGDAGRDRHRSGGSARREPPLALLRPSVGRLAAGAGAGGYRGQTQKGAGYRFTGTDDDIRIDVARPEFSAWRWVAADDLAALIVPFKRDGVSQRRRRVPSPMGLTMIGRRNRARHGLRSSQAPSFGNAREGSSRDGGVDRPARTRRRRLLRGTIGSGAGGATTAAAGVRGGGGAMTAGDDGRRADATGSGSATPSPSDS